MSGAGVESDYYDFMNFDRESSRSGLSHYVQYFDAGPVVELATGRGDFLQLLTERGIEARGVDIDPGMVEAARVTGVDVELGDALGYLAAQRAGSLRGLFCAHFLEHLPSEDVARVYVEAGRVLAPGGTFVAAVPSAASLSVLRYDFWRDPTHVRFYDPLLLSFFAAQGGLSVVESGANPLNDPGPPPPVIPLDLDTAPSVSAEFSTLVEQIKAAQPPPRKERAVVAWARSRLSTGHPEPASPLTSVDMSERLIHLAVQLDQRIQHVQHHAYTLGTAYRALLAALYPPNEVYVVARRPSVDREPGAEAGATDG